MTILSYILAFMVAIGILVAVHEYGTSGWRVVSVSACCGSRSALASGCGRGRAKTARSMRFLQSFRGYVKLLDEREGPVATADLSAAYNRKPVWQRILILLAGPFANFLFAAAAYWVLFVAGIPALKPVLGRSRRSRSRRRRPRDR